MCGIYMENVYVKDFQNGPFRDSMPTSVDKIGDKTRSLR